MLSFTLIGLTVLFSIAGFNSADTLSRFLFYPYAIAQRREYWRFLTGGFLHADWQHLLFNMFALYMFGGENIERVFTRVFPYGGFFFVALYLSAIVVANIPDYILQRNNPYFRALGASGATSAMMFAFIFFAPWASISLYGVLPLPAFAWGGIYLAYSSYMSYRGGDNVGHNAHFFGALYGLLFMFALSAVFMPELMTAFFSELFLLHR